MPVRSFVFVITAACLTFSTISTAQDGNPPAASAPLKASISVPAAGENAALDGVLVVKSSLSQAANGATELSYSCEVSGSAAGESSGGRFAMSGSQSGDVEVSQALPVDVGLTCSMALAAPNVVQQFRLTLQATVGADGTITDLVFRTIAAL